MKFSILNIPQYLNLNKVGLLEIVFALVPLLSGYGLGSLPLSVLIWVLLLVIVLIKGKIGHIRDFMAFKIFVIFWILHQILIFAVDDVNLNGFLSTLLYFVAVFVLYPNLDMEKLKGSLNWVALISIIGLLYQWTDIMRGEMVHPLELPGLTMAESRLTTESLRPSSFFMEPASYVAFMCCPLLFALNDRKYIWATTIILSMFLTTSTTGLIVSFIMLGVSFLSGKKVRLSGIIPIIVIGVGLMYALTNWDVFDYGVNKLETIDTETNVRLTQGPYVVSTMKPEEYIIGVPYSTSYRYCKDGRASDVAYYGDNVYMSTFWQMLLLYGIIGLLLYLNVYFQIAKRCRQTLPLIAALTAVLFSSGYGTGIIYVFTLIVLLCILYNNDNQLIKAQ